MATALAQPLRPQPNIGLGRGVGLALLAHVVLLLALKAGLDWRSHDEPALEAELWSAIPEAAAPKAVEPEPPPPARPEPKPRVQEPEPQREAQIAIERERKLREKLQEQRELAERKKQERLAAEKLRQEQAKADKLKEEQDKRAKAQEEARRAAQRQENLRRIQGLAGASGGPQSTGTAQHSSGPGANYAGRIKARVRPNIVFAETVAGNPLAEVEVRCAPDGLILAARLLKSSGHAGWDQAVLRAVEKTERLPRDTDGRVPASMVLAFRPNE